MGDYGGDDSERWFIGTRRSPSAFRVHFFIRDAIEQVEKIFPIPSKISVFPWDDDLAFNIPVHYRREHPPTQEQADSFLTYIADLLKLRIYGTLQNPPPALNERREGIVLTTFVIQKDGTISDVAIRESSDTMIWMRLR